MCLTQNTQHVKLLCFFCSMYCVIVVYSAALSEILSNSLSRTRCKRESAGGERAMKKAHVKQHTYPKVLINPLVEPSAYREQMSPIWRKLDILSDMVPLAWLHLEKISTQLFTGVFTDESDHKS